MPPSEGPAESGRSVLRIDLDAVAANYRLLASRLTGGRCGAVVKADGYGLGADRIAGALATAGCDDFFVATAGEGTALRRHLPRARIFVLNGVVAAGDAAAIRAAGLVPVLNHRAQAEIWQDTGAEAPCALHVDTGMTRLGLSAADLDALEAAGSLRRLHPVLLLSHLACAEETANPMNRAQLDAFLKVRARLPSIEASIANSSGIFLGPDFHLDVVRPGAALYGINPTLDKTNPMHQAIKLQGRIVQVRDIDSPRTVGYGATYRLSGHTRIATIAVGYADGYLRTLSNRGSGHIGNIRVPVVGRVSMDLITLDVTAVPAEACQPGGFVELIGPHQPIDAVAAEAGTIAYEMLTRLGPRLARVYEGG